MALPAACALSTVGLYVDALFWLRSVVNVCYLSQFLWHALIVK